MCDQMRMAPQDKKLIRSYVSEVERVSASLRDSEANTRKDRELASYFRSKAEDLEHVTADFLDTLERI